MKQVLQESVIYPYLRPNPVNLLVQARSFAKEMGLLDSDILPCGNGSFFIAPWVGTKEIRTISTMFSCGLKQQLDVFAVASASYYLQVTSALSSEEFVEKFKATQIPIDNPDIILPENQTPKIDKYDPMVPDHLLRFAFLYNQMNIPEAIDIINNLALSN